MQQQQGAKRLQRAEVLAAAHEAIAPDDTEASKKKSLKERAVATAAALVAAQWAQFAEAVGCKVSACLQLFKKLATDASNIID